MNEHESDENLTVELSADEQVDQESQQLVAYLDGELDAASSAQVEERLADDAEFRLRLQQLQRAWDLLDELPRTQQNEDFTRSTVELITFSAQDELQATKSKTLRRTAAAWLVKVGFVAVAVITGWFAGDWYFGREQRQLIEDLPVINQFDEFRLTEDLDFLKQLMDADLFDEEQQDEN